MKKIEQVYREILYQVIEKGKKEMTQLELSEKLSISTSTVNLAIKKLEKMNAVKIGKMGLSVIDKKKILYLWASIRNLEKDIIYRTRVEESVREIENKLPDITYAGYSAYKFRFKDVPADYSEVYSYASNEQLSEIKKRFPLKDSNPNLFILKADENLDDYSKTGSTGQIFVDLWNLKEWYANDFLKALQNKIDLKND